MVCCSRSNDGNACPAPARGHFIKSPQPVHSAVRLPVALALCGRMVALRMSASGTTRTSGDVRLESEKRSKADIEQTSTNDRVRRMRGFISGLGILFAIGVAITLASI